MGSLRLYGSGIRRDAAGCFPSSVPISFIAFSLIVWGQIPLLKSPHKAKDALKSPLRFCLGMEGYVRLGRLGKINQNTLKGMHQRTFAPWRRICSVLRG
jgi:hypothetical protein